MLVEEIGPLGLKSSTFIAHPLNNIAKGKNLNI
jgi:hypothetical protein